MIAEQIDAEYYFYLITWVAGPALLFAILGRRGRLPGLLVFTYILGFCTNHWPGALVHATSSDLLTDSAATITGFRLSTYGLQALMCGALLIRGGGGTYLTNTRFGAPALPLKATIALKNVAASYVTIGIIIWIVGFSPLASLPGMSAALPAGRQCLLLGVCLLIWDAWQRGAIWPFRGWVASGLCLPIVTVVTQGFIGYGIMMLGAIVVFVAMFYRPRWHLASGLLVGIFFAMSLWGGYSAHRIAIRETVWGGQSYGARAEAVLNMLASLAPFDPRNERDVATIDERLNQNILVGEAMRVTPDLVPYEEGKTILDAAIAIIPRAIWPDKPVVGGSGNYVAIHTMRKFAENTSVGMGQVLEFYINFGIECVLIGFLLLGMFLRYLDVRMSEAIVRGDIATMQLCFLVGAGALQSGGSLSEIVASMGGGAVMSLLITRYLAWRGAPSSRSPRRRPKVGRQEARRATS